MISTTTQNNPTNEKQSFKPVLKVDTFQIVQFAYNYGLRTLIPLTTKPDTNEGKTPEYGCSVKDPKWKRYEWLLYDTKTGKERILKHNMNKNIGIVIPEDRVVIDIDNKIGKDGINGIDYFTSLIKLNTQYSTIEEYCKEEGISYTLTPSNGYHLWYEYIPIFRETVRSRFKASDVIDIKRPGEYIIAPYSMYMGCHPIYKDKSNGETNEKSHKCGGSNDNCLYKGKLYTPFWVEKPDMREVTYDMKIKPLFTDWPNWVKLECISFDDVIARYTNNIETSKFKTDDIYDDRVERFAKLCNSIWVNGSYDDWKVLIWAIKDCLGESGRELVHECSKHDTVQYTEKQTNFIFDSGKLGNFSIGTIRYYAKTCSPKEYEKLCFELYKKDTTYLSDKKKRESEEEKRKNTLVIDDLYASHIFISILGTKCRKNEGTLYFFDTDTGLWERDNKSHDAYFKNVTRHKDKLIFSGLDEGGKEKEYNYGGMKTKALHMLSYVQANVKETYFLKDLDSSIGKLLFSDGIYDFKTNVFTPGFDENIIFIHRINRPFPTERNEESILYLYHILFQKPFDKNIETIKAGDFLLQTIARGLYGDYTVKQFTFSVGNGNSGKGMLVTALKSAFGHYVGEFDGNQLLVKGENTDCSRELSWLLDLQGTRIAFSNECKMSPKGIDGNTIKKVASGGDSHLTRKVFENQEETICRTSMFFLCNDMPKISPWDTGVEKRVKVANYTREFLEYKKCVLREDGSVDESSNISLEDETIKNRLKNEVALHDALFHLIIDTFQKIYKPRTLQTSTLLWDIPIPSCVEEATTERKQENKGGHSNLKELLEERFIFTNNKTDKVPFQVLEEYMRDNGYKSDSSTRISLLIQELLPSDWTKDEKKGKAKILFGDKKVTKSCIYGIRDNIDDQEDRILSETTND